MKKNIFLACLAVTIVLGACKKSEDFTTEAISDYAPLEIGKYITYQLDSSLFADNVIPYDRVISYQVKHVIEDSTVDNLGRKAFIMRRYIRKTTADDWVLDNTFTAINTGASYEFIEDNLRFLKLKVPLKNGFSWKGNSYIDASSSYSDVQYFDNWDYTYDSINTPLTLGAITVDNTLKVDESDDTLGNPDDPSVYSEINFSVSNYGKGIGLVYRRFLHQEYQPPTPGTVGYKTGYGITLTMIDHN